MENTRTVRRAYAAVHGAPAYPKLQGEVHFTQIDAGVVVEAFVEGLPSTPSGFFAFHLHEGECGEAGSDPANAFPSSGGHYNPGMQPHPRHAGDFPPLIADSQGRAYLRFMTDRFALEQVIDRSVVIHLQPDDFHTQPSGDSGPKIACGTIRPARGRF